MIFGSSNAWRNSQRGRVFSDLIGKNEFVETAQKRRCKDYRPLIQAKIEQGEIAEGSFVKTLDGVVRKVLKITPFNHLKLEGIYGGAVNPLSVEIVENSQ